MAKKILVSGCSHVFGHGFEDCLDGLTPSQYAWPNMIQKNFNCEIINLSAPGSSPIACIERIQNYKDKQNLDAMLVMLPGSNRYLYSFKDQFQNATDFHFTSYGLGKSQWEKVLASYYKFCHNWRTNEINFISYIGYLKHISSVYNIPLWLGTAIDEDYSFLIKEGIELDLKPDWETYCQIQNFSKLSDGHYGYDAHETFYRDYVDPWIKEKVFASVA